MKRIKKMDYELLQRYIEGRVTAEEAEQVVDWLDADEAHVKEFMALHKAFDISVMNQSAAQTLQKRAKQMKLRKEIDYGYFPVSYSFDEIEQGAAELCRRLGIPAPDFSKEKQKRSTLLGYYNFGCAYLHYRGIGHFDR